MSKFKLKPVQIRHETKRSGAKIDIIETKMVEIKGLCKRCQRNERANGSSSCGQCSVNHTAKLHSIGVITKTLQRQRSK